MEPVFRVLGARADWRVHVAYDLCGARFSHFELSDKHGAEDLRRGPITPGEIYIADRNYARLRGLCYIVKNGGDFIVRIGWRKVKMLHPDGTPFDLFGALAQLNEGCSDDIPVLVVDGSGRVELSDLPVRLIMVRKSAAAIKQQHRRLRKNASKSGHKLDQRTLIASEYMLLLTSLPQAEFGLDMVASLYRLRWQVELAFKRMKSLAHLDKLPAKDNELARSWIYAHLIVALLIDDSCQEFLDSPPVRAAGTNRPASIWRLQKLMLDALLSAIRGTFDTFTIISYAQHLTRHICDPPRKRKKQMISAIYILS